RRRRRPSRRRHHRRRSPARARAHGRHPRAPGPRSHDDRAEGDRGERARRTGGRGDGAARDHVAVRDRARGRTAPPGGRDPPARPPPRRHRVMARRRSLWRRLRRTTRGPRNAVLARAIRGLGAAVGALPVPVALALGRGLGTVAYAFMAGPRALAIAHMGLAFPDLDRTARARLARETFRHAGQSFVELALWTKLTRRPGYVAVEGDEAIRAALAEGRGCIAVAGHLGNWELLAATMAARGWPITVVARQVNDLRFHRLIYDFRTAAGVEVLLRDDASFLSAVRGALRRGRIVALLIDQD